MLKWVTILFTLFIFLVIVLANAGGLPRPLKQLANFPGGDKTGHFVLFGILSFLLNKSVLSFLSKRKPARIILTVSLFLAILIGLEEWSQSLFPARTMSLSDLLASLSGVLVSALLVYWTSR